MISIIWEDPELVYTKNGQFFVRKWNIPDEYRYPFFKFWEKNDHLKKEGFSLKKDETDKWVLTEWKRFKKDFLNIGKYRSDVDFQIPETPSHIYKEIKDKSGLRDWQPSVVSKLCASLQKYKAAIDGSDLGTGKTYAAVACARELGLKILVVCPKAVITSWNRVIREHFKMTPEAVINYESLRTGKYTEIGVWYKKNPKTTIKYFKWNVKDPNKTLIIFDESHKLKNWDSQNAEMAVAAKNSGCNILCISATNAINPIELRTTGYILGIHSGKSKDFNDFLLKCGCEKTKYGWIFENNEKVLKRLNFELFKERGARIKKEEIPNFPECDLTCEAYDLDEDSTKEFNKISAELHEYLEQLGNKKCKDAIVKFTRARQKFEILKIPLFIEMAEEAIQNNMSVAIFVNFSETIKILSEKLNTKCIVDGNNIKERQQNIDDFQSDKSRIIILNIAAGGAGVSLHDLNGNHPRLAIISPTPSAVNLKQVTGRVWRAGAKTKAIQKIIFVAETPEEDICIKMKTKLNNMDLLNDGDLTENNLFSELHD